MLLTLKYGVVHVWFLLKILFQTNLLYAVALFILAIVNGVIPSINALINAQIIDTVSLYIGCGNWNKDVYYLVLDRFVMMFISICANNIFDVLSSLCGNLVINQIRVLMSKKSEEIDIASYDSPDFYGQLENALQEINSRPVGIFISLCTIISNLVGILSYFLIISKVSTWIAVFAILIGLPQFYISSIFRKRTFNYNMKSTLTRRKMKTYFSIQFDHRFVKELRIYNLFPWFFEKYMTMFKKFYIGLRKIIFDEFVTKCFFNIIYILLQAIIYLYILEKTIGGKISIGEFSLYIASLISIINLTKGVSDNIISIYSGSLFVNNLIVFLGKKSSIINPCKTLEKSTAIECIKFCHVFFKYSDMQKYILKDISFNIIKGDTIGIVGLNGSGKSTLIKLMLRLYDPSEGEITINGRDIRSYCPEDIYAMMSVVFQDYGRYPETIRQTINFGNVSSTEMSLIASASHQSTADSFIRFLPNKYDTMLTRLFYETGQELSVGQWQKLALARAFYRNSCIQIFDEPTSAIDVNSERIIFNQIMKKEPNKIKIIITHKLAVLEKADKIIVLHKGEIVGIGTHKELLHNCLVYGDMFHDSTMQS